MEATDIFFNAAQPGVGRVQVLGSKKFLQKKLLHQSLVSAALHDQISSSINQVLRLEAKV